MNTCWKCFKYFELCHKKKKSQKSQIQVNASEKRVGAEAMWCIRNVSNTVQPTGMQIQHLHEVQWLVSFDFSFSFSNELDQHTQTQKKQVKYITYTSVSMNKNRILFSYVIFTLKKTMRRWIYPPIQLFFFMIVLLWCTTNTFIAKDG